MRFNDQGELVYDDPVPPPPPPSAPAQPSAGTGGVFGDWLKSTFGGQPAPAQPNPDLGAQALRNLGFDEDTPEFRLYRSYMDAARSLYPEPSRYYGGARSNAEAWAQGIGDILASGAYAWAGYRDPTAHVRRSIDQTRETVQNALERSKALQLSVIQAAVAAQAKRLDEARQRERNRETARVLGGALGVYGNPAEAPPAAGATDQQTPADTAPTPAAPLPAVPGVVIDSPGSPVPASPAAGAPQSPHPRPPAAGGGAIGEIRSRLQDPEARAFLDTGIARIMATAASGANATDAIKELDEVVRQAIEMDSGYQARKAATTERAKGLEKADRETEEEIRSQAAGAREVLDIVQQIRGMLLRPKDGKPGETELVPGAHDAFGPIQGFQTYQSAAAMLPDVLNRWIANPELHTRLATALRKLGSASVRLNFKGQGAISNAEREAAAEAMAGNLRSANPEIFLQTLMDTEALAREKLEREEMLRSGGLEGLRQYDERRNRGLLNPSGRTLPDEKAAGTEPDREERERLPVGATFKFRGVLYRKVGPGQYVKADEEAAAP